MITNFIPQHSVDSSRYTLRAVPLALRAQWDIFIATHANGHFLQSWGWGELKALLGWYPLRLALWDGETMVAATQILRKTVPPIPLFLVIWPIFQEDQWLIGDNLHYTKRSLHFWIPTCVDMARWLFAGSQMWKIVPTRARCYGNI